MPALRSEDLDHVLRHTRDLWDGIRGKRLFVTGGTGFFGVWLVESFLWANERLGLQAQMVVLSRDPEAFRRKMPHLANQRALGFHAGDVRCFAFPDGPFSHVIHAAAPDSATYHAREASLVVDTIVDGTRRTLDFALRCGASRFLLASSGAVYGPQPADLTHIPETFRGAADPMDLASAYGHGKRFAEHLSALYAGRHGIEAAIARGFTFVGPHLPLDLNYAVGNFLRDALAGGPIRIEGDGTPCRSYLYAADLAVWLWTILFRGKNCRPYNVGSDQDLTIAELARAVASAVAPPAEIKIAKAPRPGEPPLRYVPATKRAADELGLLRGSGWTTPSTARRGGGGT